MHTILRIELRLVIYKLEFLAEELLHLFRDSSLLSEFSGGLQSVSYFLQWRWLRIIADCVPPCVAEVPTCTCLQHVSR